MKKIIVAVIIMILISISYLGAEDRETVDPAKDKTLMPLKGYLPLPAMHTYYFYKEAMTKETEKVRFLGFYRRAKTDYWFWQDGCRR